MQLRFLDRRRVRSLAIALSSAVCACVFLRVLDREYPIRTWLFWSLARVWGYAVLESAGVLSVGLLVVRRVLRVRDRPPLEFLVLGQTVGVVVVTNLLWLAGALHLFKPVVAVMLLVALLAVGSFDVIAVARDWLATRDASPAPSGPLARSLAMIALAYGVVCIVAVYLQAMTPESINFDAAWCHLTVAQDYARHGRIVPFPGDYARNHPQLAGMMHTWGWLMPGLSRQEHWMLALHEEFVILLWTLAGVSAVVRWLLDDETVAHAWVVFFLFPAIFVYDSNIGGAADHYLAFFAPAVLLATGRLVYAGNVRDAALLGTAAAGAMQTKYQGAYFLLPAAVVIGVAGARFAILQARRASGGLWRAVRSQLAIYGIGLAVFTGLVAAHFVKNYVFYRNPMFPFMQDFFTKTTPTVPQASLLMRHLYEDTVWVPPGPWPHRVLDSLLTTLTFHLEPHYSFTGNVPDFGSLFAFTLPFLVLAQRTRRIAIGAALGWGFLFIWAMTFRVDRNLQAIVPILAAVTAALLVRAWQVGTAARVSIGALVTLQVIWSGDALVYSGLPRMLASFTMIQSGFAHKIAERSRFRAEFTQINDVLPPDAVLLRHDTRVSLGIDRDTIMDTPGQQGLISYEGLAGPRALYDLFRSQGVTHILFESHVRPAETKTIDVLLTELVRHYSSIPHRYGRFDLVSLSRDPPPPDTPYRVLALGLPGYADGLYRVERMTTHERLPRELRGWPRPDRAWPSDPVQRRELLDSARAVVARPARIVPGDAGFAAFQQVTKYEQAFSIYLRAQPRARRPAAPGDASILHAASNLLRMR